MFDNLSKNLSKNINIIDRIKYINEIIPDQSPENDDGNREYKRNLLSKSSESKSNKHKINTFYNKRATQMLHRLHQGNGKALYIIGIEDNGKCTGLTISELNETLENLLCIVNIVSCTINNIRIYNTNNINNTNDNDKNKFIVTVRLAIEFDNFNDYETCTFTNYF